MDTRSDHNRMPEEFQEVEGAWREMDFPEKTADNLLIRDPSLDCFLRMIDSRLRVDFDYRSSPHLNESLTSFLD